MSGPKAGHYTVVSAEELRRRRLAAAKERFARAAGNVAALHAEVVNAEATYGLLSTEVLAATRPRGEDAEQWEKAAADLESNLAGWRQQVGDAVRAARVRNIAAAAGGVTASLAPDAPRASAQPTSASANEEIARVVGRLPAGASPETVARCTQLAYECRQASGQHQEHMIATLRLLVQRETDRAKLAATNRDTVDALYRELDGLAGPKVETVRGLLRGLVLEQPLPADLHARVAAARDEARSGQDRAFALAAAARALEDLGYGVDADFVTAVPAGGVLVDLPHSSRHGIMVRERDHTLLFNVVRYDESGSRDVAADTQAEMAFCRDFADFRAALAQDWVQLSMQRADPPGAVPVQVIQEPATRRRARARPRTMERTRERRR